MEIDDEATGRPAGPAPKKGAPGKRRGDPRRTRPGSGPPEVVIDDEVYVVVEGDMPLEKSSEYRRYLEMTRPGPVSTVANRNERGFRGRSITQRESRSALVGMTDEDGKFVRWSPGTVLSYCVLRRTFPRAAWYDEVVENMDLAAREWEETCGVQFEHRASEDDSPSTRPDDVLFPVRHIAANGAFIAAAFFPSDPPDRWRMLVDPSFHTTRFDRTGVFRHELGHVLGFRHEHIRSGAPAICPDESSTGSIDLTAYDPKSVMHYFCGGMGSRDLRITEVDRTGSQLVYGPSFEEFVNLTPAMSSGSNGEASR